MKKRADELLVMRGLVDTRSRAKALIMAGQVYCGDTPILKAGQLLAPDSPLTLKEAWPYVSRGGVKLAHALKTFSLDVTGHVALDVGASTGGFTDCLLQAGARLVYALDVGYGQLAWRLRQDDRVVVIERTNIRHWTGAELSEAPSFIAVDVSFISLKKVIPPLQHVLQEKGAAQQRAVFLIKPQFESKREEVGSGGVVRDPEVIARVVAELEDFVVSEGWELIGVSPSPLAGPKGNQEQLLAVKRTI